MGKITVVFGALLAAMFVLLAPYVQADCGWPFADQWGCVCIDQGADVKCYTRWKFSTSYCYVGGRCQRQIVVKLYDPAVDQVLDSPVDESMLALHEITSSPDGFVQEFLSHGPTMLDALQWCVAHPNDCPFAADTALMNLVQTHPERAAYLILSYPPELPE